MLLRATRVAGGLSLRVGGLARRGGSPQQQQRLAGGGPVGYGHGVRAAPHPPTSACACLPRPLCATLASGGPEERSACVRTRHPH